MAPGKTAPRLLQDLLTYDPRYEQRAGRNLLTSAPPQYDPDGPKESAVPFRNCRHTLFNKSEQSQLPSVGEEPDHTTVYKVASYCNKCRWHIDVVVDFRDDSSRNRPCKQGDTEFSLHHFLFQGEDESNGTNGLGAHNKPRTYKFRCSAPQCPVQVTIGMKPPRFSEQDVETLTNQAQLRRRWETAKQIAGDRADTSMARRVDAPDFLNTYLQDALNPVKGKARIPLLNKKFLKTFGKDCDSILKGLGFTSSMEEEDDGTMAEVWYLPKPEAAKGPLESTLRNVIEDARYELNTIIVDFPESERTSCRHQAMYPTPSRGDIERALACNDYEKWKGRRETRNTNHQEDHPYYASLGAVGDFSDALVLFAFSRQGHQDMANQPYYFECLKDLAVGRKSDMLGTQVAVLASGGLTSKRELEAAYKYFSIDPAHAGVIGDDHIIGSFRARLSDISPAMAEEARKQLRVLGDARNSDKIRAEAADAIETYEQAMAWFELENNTADDFVTAMFGLKTQDNPSCMETAQKALSIIAEKRQSQRLRQFLKSGTMTEPEMDVGDAYAVFNIKDRTVALDLDVLKTSVDIASSDEVERYQKAFAIIQQHQAQTFNNHLDNPNRPAEARRNNYPLETWPVGLRNIGNTCYLNSVLQFLFTIKPLRELILNCDDYMQDPSPEALKDKKVGRTAVTAERVAIAQEFIRELRTFFRHMISAPTDTVQPAIDLAALALCRLDTQGASLKSSKVDATESPGLGSIDGVAVIGPILAPIGDVNPMTPADSVMNDDKDDAKSDTSMQAMDLEDQSGPPAPPTRPPPIPPRPDVQTKSKIGSIEESAQQQDAAEVMGNIFDLLSCAIKSEDVMRDGEQLDTIKRLFFSDVTTVRETAKGTEKLSELRDHFLVSPGWRDRHLYGTLDDDFGQSEMEGGGTRYEYIAHAAPIQIINLRRIQFNHATREPTYDRSHIGLDSTLYFDRYLGGTNTLDEAQLLKLREAQWAKQQKLREAEAERQNLHAAEIDGMDLADVVEEASFFVNNLAEASELQYSTQDSLPTPPPELADALHDKAKSLKEHAEGINVLMSDLESQIDTVFKDCNDHPYRLHAVFTHRGGTRGGHYWIYIYDFQAGLWRSYNDDVVAVADEKQIFEREEGVLMGKASTGVVYIRADLVDQMTEAVCRRPEIVETNGEPVADTQTTDVEMGDADDEGMPPLVPVKYDGLPVIDGVEKE